MATLTLLVEGHFCRSQAKCQFKSSKKINAEVEKEANVNLLNIGTCGLHTLHNSFKSGYSATTWRIEEQMIASYYLFHESPARTDDFKKYGNPDKFILSQHRWLANASVFKRAAELRPALSKYVQAAKAGKCSCPSVKSFTSVMEGCNDPLFVAKCEFFITLSETVEPFLTTFQSDLPLAIYIYIVPFLANDLADLIRQLLSRIVKNEVLDKLGTSVEMLTDFDVKDDHNYKGTVDVGFVANRELQILKASNKISDRGVLQFRMECRKFIVSLVEKLLLKSPIKYPLARYCYWLNPNYTNTTKAKRALENCLQILLDVCRVNQGKCDLDLSQFSELRLQDTDTMHSFNRKVDRLDKFYYSLLSCGLRQKLF